jgi:glycerol-3-phosphate dehydrogenase
MKRDLNQLASQKYDLLVIGGGIYGACIAWDATLRGLSVALIDKGDFGQAASANSLKIIHGGLRYLQDGNLELMRLMAKERMIWMRIAPHLVHPLPCLIPTYRQLGRNKLMIATALRLNDWVSYDRNHLIDPQKHLPNGRLISKAECLALMPGVIADGITGGAIWYDAQMYNSERLLLSFILSAAEAGAQVANYVEMIGFLPDEKGIRGVKAKNVLTGEMFDIQAKVVVNSTGAWVDAVLGLLNGRSPAPRFHRSIAINLVTRQILPKWAVGVSSQYTGPDKLGRSTRRSPMLFIVPWRHYSLIGTIHASCAGASPDYHITEEVIGDFIDKINATYPGVALTRDDISHIHWGFLPMVQAKSQVNEVKLVREGRVYNHEPEDGIAGLITVVGVKYTTARGVAQTVVNLVVKKLGRKVRPCQTHQTPVYGGQIARFDDFLAWAIENRPCGLSPEIIKHLVYTYGSQYLQVLKYLAEKPAWSQTITALSPVIKAEVIHAAREEMVQKLTDVIQRRTELGAAGRPDEACLCCCADLLAAELGWDQARRDQEIDEVRAAYATTTAPLREKVGAN